MTNEEVSKLNVEDQFCFPFLLSLVMEENDLDSNLIDYVLTLIWKVIKVFSEAKWDKLIKQCFENLKEHKSVP